MPKPKRSKFQEVLNGLNKGLVADTLGGPVDLTTMLINAPFEVAGKGKVIDKPVGGSDWIIDKMAKGGFLYDDGEDTGLTEDAVRLGSGLLGPAGVVHAPQTARAAVKGGKALAQAGAERVDDFLADSGLTPGITEVVPKHLRGRTLQGLPDKVKVDGEETIYHGFKPAQSAAERYAAQIGLMDYSRPEVYAPLDPQRATRLASAYDTMPHAPQDPAVREAYNRLAEETMAQYAAARRAGLKVDFMPESGDPYGNPRNALKDVYQNNHMFVFPTDAGFGGPASSGVDITGNPLLQLTDEKISGRPARVNDIFRVVHDYFGHAKEGVGFRAGGEENAWQQHASMFSPAARRAMTSETRGQNSWVNFGPHAAKNKTASPADTEYAPQKTGLLPEWASREGYVGLRLPRRFFEEE